MTADLAAFAVRALTSIGRNVAAEWIFYAAVALALGTGIGFDLWRKRSLMRRYFSPGFRTDIVYGLAAASHVLDVWIFVPFTALLTASLERYAPWLHLNAAARMPGWLQFVTLFVLADFTAYWWHRLLHANVYLWQFHKIHHSQQQITALTTFRKTIPEKLMGLIVLAIPVALMGTHYAVPAVLIALLQFRELIQHANTGWHFGPLDRLIVSPAFHEVHHSSAPEHADRNFGDALSAWDWLFGTAVQTAAQPLAYGVRGEIIPESWLWQHILPFVSIGRMARERLPRWLRSSAAGLAPRDRGPDELAELLRQRGN